MEKLIVLRNIQVGTDKVFWNDISAAIKRVNKDFWEKVEKLQPDETYPLYLVSFPYGSLIGDDKSQFIPTRDNSYYRLNSPDAPQDIKEHLGYGSDSSPLGLVIDKTIEFFVDAPDRKVTIPKKIVYPGEFINFSRILNFTKREKAKPVIPNGLLKAMAGARTTFSLPYLTCNASFIKLERDIGELSKIPECQYDHFQLFSDIANSERYNEDWELKFVYFSEKWIQSIMHDSKWTEVKSLIYQTAWDDTSYQRSQYFFDVSFSIMKEQENAKQNPYVYDTARHIFDIAIGAFPGLAPSISSDLVPINSIQSALINSYGLKKYIPTIITPSYFSLDAKLPVYYSMHYPTLRLFTPMSATNKKSVLSEFQNLSRAIHKFTKRIKDENSIWNGTILKDAAEQLQFDFVHTSSREGVSITYPQHVTEKDPRFLFVHAENAIARTPSLDGNFFRGCVSLSID